MLYEVCVFFSIHCVCVHVMLIVVLFPLSYFLYGFLLHATHTTYVLIAHVHES